MSDHEKRTPAIQVGQLVTTPAGRLAVVQSVDAKRGEASVLGVPWGACFRLSILRPAAPGEAVVFVGNLTPAEAANDGEPER